MAPKPSGAAADGPNKRKAGNQPASARSDTFLQKRAKVHAARKVPSQLAHAALKDGELDLQAFVAAHEFEIRSLQQSMAMSKAVSTTRAFQQVPRGLRRRTASHNPKRVPRRLRARANREMAEDNTPLVQFRRRKPGTTRARLRAETAKRLRRLVLRAKQRKLKNKASDGHAAAVVSVPRPKIRRNQLNDVPRPHAKFRRRQMNKTWLPTHLWHAKRARMTEPKNPLWRFSMPVTPNEKVYRPVHRAQRQKGAVVWDASYMSTIGIYGTSSSILTMLSQIGLPKYADDNAFRRRWQAGVTAWTGMLSKTGQDDGNHGICPCTIVWNIPFAETNSSDNVESIQRQAFLRVHPSAFLEVFDLLLGLIKTVKPRPYIEDLRFEIGSIELTGPASTETLLSVIAPYENGSAPAQSNGQLFKSLAGVTNPASLPANAVLPFIAQDPRLRYPPQKVEQNLDQDAQTTLLHNLATWPVAQQQKTGCPTLFDRAARHRASRLPTQKAINRRRGTKKVPGTGLKPGSTDPPIPVLLIATRGSIERNSKTQGTWTVMLPWKCVLPFWYSIAHCPLTSGGNPRFGGLNESMQVAFERAQPWFPGDYIGTSSGLQWELDQREKRYKDWSKRPKSKRTEWSSLNLGAGRKGEIGNGLTCDFEYLFGLPKTQAPWQTKQSNCDQPTSDAAFTTPTLCKTSPLQSLRVVPRGALSNKTPLNGTNLVMNVRISILSRGVVGPCARIYRLPRRHQPAHTDSAAEVPSTIPPADQTTSKLPIDLRQQWLAQLPCEKAASSSSTTKPRNPHATDMQERMRLFAKELTQAPMPYPAPDANATSIAGHHPLVPDAEDLIGFVTSGSFCLTNGHGAAMGTIAWHKIIDGFAQSAKEAKLCIVRNAGENVGWIARWDEM